MPGLTSLPPELRNNIYELLLQVDHPISIVSSRKARKAPESPKSQMMDKFFHRTPVQRPEKHFASLIGVCKQIGDEARTTFYGQNKFILGNGPWGSTYEPNSHGLKTFLSRVPHHAVAQIKHLELAIYFTRNDVTPPSQQRMFPNDVSEFERLCKTILKHFTGITKIVVVERRVRKGYGEAGVKNGPAKAMIMLLRGLKKLEEIVFVRDEHCWMHLDPIARALSNKSPVGFKALVGKILEIQGAQGKAGEEEKRVVLRSAETTPTNQSQWSL
ncbi:hypothetical protein LZ554_004110 [Drepanopeziza brunnea f. sp. 'monogermtubi']|nr:hypothetical protein LZ554_004110 [Drepanopeziza brunnea f. sp. 'monogermtubi']